MDILVLKRGGNLIVSYNGKRLMKPLTKEFENMSDEEIEKYYINHLNSLEGGETFGKSEKR